MKTNSPLTTPINRRNFLRLAALVGTSAAASILLGGCSSEQSSSPQDITQNDANSDSATQAEQNSPSGSQTLIAVFSWSGNTLQVAEHIHELIQGDFSESNLQHPIPTITTNFSTSPSKSKTTIPSCLVFNNRKLGQLQHYLSGISYLVVRCTSNHKDLP